MTGLLLLLPLGLAIGCGDSGSDVPAGYKRVEIGGLRFVVPSDLPVDEHPDGGELFIASRQGKLVMQPRVVGSVDTSPATLLQVVADIRDVNTFGLRDFKPVSDTELDIPGSEGAHRVVQTYITGDKGSTTSPRRRRRSSCTRASASSSSRSRSPMPNATSWMPDRSCARSS